MKDLVVLVADSQQKAVIEILLTERYKSFKIRQMQKDTHFVVYAHPNKDPGVYRDAANFLNVFVKQYQYALVLLGAEWEGSPGGSHIKHEIQTSLDLTDWQNRSATIVIEPELEIWVWSSSTEVCNILGKTWEQIREIAEQGQLWQQGVVKPHRPKELMDRVLRQARKHRSAALFMRLAREVSLKKCQDAAFCELKQKLQEWFPSENRF